MKQISYGINNENQGIDVNPVLFPNLYKFLMKYHEKIELKRNMRRNRDEFGDC